MMTKIDRHNKLEKNNDPTIMKLAIVQTLNQSTNLHNLKTLTLFYTLYNIYKKLRCYWHFLIQNVRLTLKNWMKVKSDMTNIFLTYEFL
jgi:hypothetical protein